MKKAAAADTTYSIEIANGTFSNGKRQFNRKDETNKLYWANTRKLTSYLKQLPVV